ncbi:enoyl-CoA hydratase [Novosphingobium barchaimii LL02]|uniref:Enoyl-CoA hydratase n=1 Tax=Novosphingobium barchaimii LL02 TaxID=1114963 RepID=A0A0J7XJ55_9SPHN|nr:crotonase/enoyl-CoA hydratase family protein [Novosphingobium barchaimii]KMS52031.1 enoyl-CoA hydratase [Novosphingobium barchaimii LL02]
MAFAFIRYEVANRIATITLARPEKLNAVNGAMVRELIAAFEAADSDDAVGAVIVTGEGRAFCAGADLSSGSESLVAPGSADLTGPDGTVDYANERMREVGGRLALVLYNLRKPVIGAINGAAAGLGATLTLPMDIRIAAEEARFGFVFARRGMVLETAASFFLPRIAGIGTSLEWCMSGRMVDAAEALRHGLVNAVVPQGDLLRAAERQAREIIDNAAPVAVALVRQMLWRGLGMAHPMEAHRIESRGIHARSRSADASEGVRSFLEKRRPAFPDRVSQDMPDFYPWWEEPPYA